MVDRHDIDALLIGSLYGELSSADEARLRAHLESHPADRTALDDLSSARQAVRASRIFEVQLEPPQAVSALLLQEAARRAPRKAREEDAGEGWFARLRRSFLMHPAMAAAAMLVVVIGVASTLYTRKSDHFAAPEFSAPELSAPAEHGAGSAYAMAPAAPAAPSPVAAGDLAPPTNTAQAQAASSEPDLAAKLTQDGQRHKDTDSAFRVGLAEGEENRRTDPQAKSAAKPKTAAEPAPRPEPASVEAKKAERQTRPMLEASTPQHVPKEILDDPRPRKAVKGRAQSDDAKPADAAPAADPPAAAKRDNMTITGRAPAAGPPAPAAVPPAPSAPDRGFSRAPDAPVGGAVGGGGGEEKLGVVDADLAWAREQHSRLINQVKAGKCNDAAGTAVSLSNRVPGYYQQNVESDRDVKNCLAYINTERDKAERARATARRINEDVGGPAQPSPSPKKAASKNRAAPQKAGAGAGAANKSAPAKADTSAKDAPASKN